ncbi:helix-turn-helix domain-containing protein [Halobacillus locisalis]|uniref:Helix-turn-helix domain-containing protein n=1 Tax=Halobacillus locisalis TaxID=220753 RepID=A0A838CP60_9BACI|nr:helix-turn-helix domain-containing protein [Halobacillus locisalis]MBA2173837.1 helix-turn-helix domain-containing protein [Halobacillus locisalis]
MNEGVTEVFEAILLTCVHHIQAERTISGIYHLLTGKRSSQTMQDAKGYALEGFFGIYKSLERHQLDHYFNQLEQKGMIETNDQQFVHLTEVGEKGYQEIDASAIAYFQGLTYHQMTPVFEKRLLLLVQTMTNITNNRRSFIPIIDDAPTQSWVRGIYASYQGQTDSFVDSLHEELHTLLSGRTTREAYVFSSRLTGNGVIGLTYEQLSTESGLSKEDVHLYLQHVYHYLLQKVRQYPSSFPILSQCIEGLGDSTLITQSANRTYYYIKLGWTIDEIMKKRRLKKSTIQDHLVEAALVIPDFSIDSFISIEGQSLILSMTESLETKRLKQIHQGLNGEFSYFQIRLTLAHHQHFSKEGTSYA